MDREDQFEWEDALHEAWKYHDKKMSVRFWTGEEYDEDNKVWDALPEVVKDAMQYLFENGYFD